MVDSWLKIDPVARALAERLSAWSSQTGSQAATFRSASGLGQLTLATPDGPSSIRILSVNSRSACDPTGMKENPGRGAGLWIPLVEVRSSMIVDDLHLPAFIDGDGFLVIDQPGETVQR